MKVNKTVEYRRVEEQHDKQERQGKMEEKKNEKKEVSINFLRLYGIGLYNKGRILVIDVKPLRFYISSFLKGKQEGSPVCVPVCVFVRCFISSNYASAYFLLFLCETTILYQVYRFCLIAKYSSFFFFQFLIGQIADFFIEYRHSMSIIALRKILLQVI